MNDGHKKPPGVPYAERLDRCCWNGQRFLYGAEAAVFRRGRHDPSIAVKMQIAATRDIAAAPPAADGERGEGGTA